MASWTRDGLLAALRPWIDEQRRTAWRPIVVPGEPTGTRAKFCGVPWLVPGEETPTCRDCGRALQLFVQLDLDALPEQLDGVFGTGVLQLFYCAGRGYIDAGDGRPDCLEDGAWEPFSNKASLVRVVRGSDLRPSARSSGHDGFPPWAIVGWEPFDDLPDPEDHESAGLAASYDFTSRTVSFRCDRVGLQATMPIDDPAVEDVAQAAEKDKLAGWPLWVQNREYPTCPRCNTSMQLVFQLDSEDHVPFMFGDAGVGHITQCPLHHDVVAFGWACS